MLQEKGRLKVEGVFELIEKGGVVMYPLIILSILSWVIIIERLFNLRVSNFLPKNIKDIKILIQKGDIEGVHKLTSIGTDPFTTALHATLDEYLKGVKRKPYLISTMESQLSGIVPAVEKNLMLLSAIASIAPLLGLFGTITGLIKVFSAYSAVQTEEAIKLLAGGISEALTAAATGLIVAIPALFAYWLFRSVGNGIISKIEQEAREIISSLE